ncbi:MAG: immune inhibitor A, partial [Acetatifactor sp.]|nr:immune inhibitor A [Acetatifactor sp.]
MKSPSKATIKKRLLAAVLALILTMAFPLPEMASAGRVQAAGSTAEIANVVVFVKFQDDTKDIFNATNNYDSSSVYYRSNWQEIRKMYDLDPDSFSNYIQAVTEGKVHVTNYFPQELPGGQKVQTLVIPRGGYIINEVVKALSDGRIKINTTDKLDNRQAGILDNLTVIIQGNTTDRGESAFRAIYADSDKVNGLLIRNYNMIPSASLLSENAAENALQQQGVIAHEFLHTLGLPDLYRSSGTGDPVGTWDIMASASCYLQYPLSYLRAREGWLSPVKTIDKSGTYTLTAVSGSGGDKVFALKTPLSDSELICLEYRKKPTNPYEFDYRIPSSGLLMYRVDNKVDGLTNNAGKNYIYVYRPGVTHPEAATDGTTNQAALDVSKGETSYGTTDLNADFTQNTLYYSDGSNSGIRISDLKLSADQSQLTFTVTFADYSQIGVWDKLDEGISGQFNGEPDICIDPATGTIYAAYAESTSDNLSATQVRVMRWNGTGWQQVGAAINNAGQPALAVCGGEVYLSYRTGDWKNVVYCKLSGNAWGQMATCAAQYPWSMQFVVDGNEIYGAFQEESGNNKRLVIYDVKGCKLVTNSLTASGTAMRPGDFSNPAVVKSGNSFYVVCAESPSGSAQIREYNMSTSSWSTAYTIANACTNTHAIVKQGQKIYAFAGYSATQGSSGGGTA